MSECVLKTLACQALCVGPSKVFSGFSDLETLTSLNKEVRPFLLSDNSMWSFPSVSSLSDYSIWRS